MKRHRTTNAEEKLISRVLRRHSGVESMGRQCKKHPPVSQMTDSQVIQLLIDETGVRPSRPWLAALCARISVPRRQQSGPVPSSEDEKKKRSSKRYSTWLTNKKKDPGAYASWLEARRTQNKDYRKRLKAAEASAYNPEDECCVGQSSQCCLAELDEDAVPA